MMIGPAALPIRKESGLHSLNASGRRAMKNSPHGRILMMRRVFGQALAIGALLAMTAAGQAQQKVIWWDFLGGGDGVRMKKMISDFNAAHAGKIEIEATTLDWGVPFYTKVQTSAAVGEGPDVMTYHTSRIPLAVEQGTLAEITADDMAKMGFSEADFAPAIWEAVHFNGKQYAVPLDTHPIVLYYNKDKLAAAGWRVACRRQQGQARQCRHGALRLGQGRLRSCLHRISGSDRALHVG
jgi:spermidine/putrescine-binding protein